MAEYKIQVAVDYPVDGVETHVEPGDVVTNFEQNIPASTLQWLLDVGSIVRVPTAEETAAEEAALKAELIAQGTPPDDAEPVAASEPEKAPANDPPADDNRGETDGQPPSDAPETPESSTTSGS